MVRNESLKRKRGLGNNKKNCRIGFHTKKINKNTSNSNIERILPFDLFRFNENIDLPSKIIDTYIHTDKKLFFKVDFSERNDGVIPESKILSSVYLRRKYPEFLIEFYESVIINSLKK